MDTRTHTQWSTRMGKCVQIYGSWNADARYLVAALARANTHLHTHLYTSDGSPLRWSPVGTAIFCTTTCHLDPAQRRRRVRLPLLSATLFHPSHSFFSSRSLFFIPRCVKPASYDNSASRHAHFACGVGECYSFLLSSQKPGHSYKSDKRKYLNSSSFYALTRYTETEDTQSHFWRIEWGMARVVNKMSNDEWDTWQIHTSINYIINNCSLKM